MTRNESDVDVGSLIEDLGVGAWFADASKVLRYINRKARAERQTIVAAMGQNVEECHKKPESVARIRELYAKWEKGSTEVNVHRRPATDTKTAAGWRYSILIPVQGEDGFKGVVELSFRADR